VGPRSGRFVSVVARLAPWAALTALAILLAGSTSLSQTLWAKVLTISGSVQIAPYTPTATEVPTAEALQGCSPGFWKQEQHFAEWPDPYLPDGSLEEALGEDVMEGSPSLLEGLQDGGGSLTALIRQAVAALLNATHENVDYDYTVEQVLALVQAAFTTGEFEPVKEMFEAANEGECPLPLTDLEIEPLSAQSSATVSPTLADTPTESATAEVSPTESPIPEEATATLEPPTPTPIPDEPTATTQPPTPEETSTSEG